MPFVHLHAGGRFAPFMMLLSEPRAPALVVEPAAIAATNDWHIVAACRAYWLFGGGMEAAFCCRAVQHARRPATSAGATLLAFLTAASSTTATAASSSGATTTGVGAGGGAGADAAG